MVQPWTIVVTSCTTLLRIKTNHESLGTVSSVSVLEAGLFVILASTHSGLGLVLVSLGLAKTRQAGPGAVSLLLCPSPNATNKYVCTLQCAFSI